MAAKSSKPNSPHRVSDSWIESFLEYTQVIPSTNRFRIWAAIGTIASALERKVFTVSSDKALYPNLYMLMVGPPGAGKTNAINEGSEIASSVDGIHMAPTATTKEYLYDVMQDSYNTDITGGGKSLFEQSAVTAFADEFAVFLKRGEVDFMVALSKLYDSPKTFTKGTKHNGTNNIMCPWLNIVGGVTPFWLKDTFTDDAFETGFPARVLLIYDDTKIRLALWKSAPAKKERFSELARDLRSIHQMQGEYFWQRPAKDFLQDWIDAGMHPRIEDRKFIHYNRRRPIQVLKLSMIIAASKSSELRITLDDVESAKVLLLEAESALGKVAKGMGSNPYKHQMDAIYDYVKRNLKNGFPDGVPEYRIRQNISREIPLNFISPTLDSMLEMKMLECDPALESPSRIFTPGRLTFEEDYNAE